MSLSNLASPWPPAVFYLPDDPGYLRVRGADRLDFLQRQSTNDLRRLNAGQVLGSVLTSPTARILDVLLVLAQGESLDLVTLPGYHQITSRFLQSRIFFNDRVVLQDASPEYCQIWLYGDQLPQLLQDLGWTDVGIAQAETFEFDQQPITIFRAAGYAEQRRYLLAARTVQERLVAALIAARAVQLDPGRHAMLRIEAGLPAAGSELTETYTPLELGLEGLISSHKGCYTGQEVIARQLTYDKVTRRLVKIALSSSVVPGAAVWLGEKRVGEITSVVALPSGGAQALAVLRRAELEPGQAVQVGHPPDRQAAVLVDA